MRLRRSTGLCDRHAARLSIPAGAIEASHPVTVTLEKILSIPAGAIEAGEGVNVLVNFLLSIPAGAIEAINVRTSSAIRPSFQYLPVRLRRDYARVVRVGNRLSIPAGAIEADR